MGAASDDRDGTSSYILRGGDDGAARLRILGAATRPTTLRLLERAGIAPGTDEAAQPLRFMVNAINNGQVAQFAAFDREGAVLQFG